MAGRQRLLSLCHLGEQDRGRLLLMSLLSKVGGWPFSSCGGMRGARMPRRACYLLVWILRGIWGWRSSVGSSAWSKNEVVQTSVLGEASGSGQPGTPAVVPGRGFLQRGEQKRRNKHLAPTPEGHREVTGSSRPALSLPLLPLGEQTHPITCLCPRGLGGGARDWGGLGMWAC